MRELGTVSDGSPPQDCFFMPLKTRLIPYFSLEIILNHCCDNRKFIRHFNDTDTLIEYLKAHPLHASYIFVKGQEGINWKELSNFYNPDTVNTRIVIIPTYNEKENIENIIRYVAGLQPAFDILIIEDNSPDGTEIS